MKIIHALQRQLAKEGELVLQLRVRPGAQRTQWKSVMADGSIKIDIAAPPEDGEANATLLRFLSRELDVPMAQLDLLTGHTAKQKRVRIRQV